MMTRIILATILAATTCFCAPAPVKKYPEIQSLYAKLQEQPGSALYFEYGVLCHNTARSSHDPDLIPIAEEALGKITSQDKEYAVARMYLGSLWTLKALHSWFPPNKLKFVQEGVAIMDQTIEANPRQPLLRYIRLSNNVNLPSFFNRTDTCRDDAVFLIGACAQPDSCTLTASQLTNVYTLLQRIYEAAGDTVKAGEIAAQLKRMGSAESGAR
ncbi:MAG: hypothetical protein HYX75_07260 [Acidobacteria bacterium]|nr:hypothetical protein [Acidobacteriota bacterium]